MTEELVRPQPDEPRYAGRLLNYFIEDKAHQEDSEELADEVRSKIYDQLNRIFHIKRVLGLSRALQGTRKLNITPEHLTLLTELLGITESDFNDLQQAFEQLDLPDAALPKSPPGTRDMQPLPPPSRHRQPSTPFSAVHLQNYLAFAGAGSGQSEEEIIIALSAALGGGKTVAAIKVACKSGKLDIPDDRIQAVADILMISETEAIQLQSELRAPGSELER